MTKKSGLFEGIMMNRKPALLTLLMLLASFSAAETFIIDSENAGWYREGGYHYTTDNILVGSLRTGTSSPFYNYNSYLIFSIPEFDNEIQSVTFSLELTMYASTDPVEDIRISAVSTPSDVLAASHTLSDTGLAPWIYEDLMDGPELGVLEVNAGTLHPFIFLGEDQGPVFSCTFNAAAVQIIQDATGGTFAVGLSLISTRGGEDEYVFTDQWSGDPDFWVRQLEITTVPEPTMISLFVAGVASFRRIKKTKQCWSAKI